MSLMASCFGCFHLDRHPRASAAAPILHHSRTSPSQVADISHLLGTDGQGTKAKEVSKLMSLVHVPQHGQYAYEEVGHLGDAQQRTLKLMRHKRSKELVAVKFVRQSADTLLDKNVEREILNHRQLVHPNILGFREVFTTETDLAIVVEYASAGQLADKCRSPMPESEARGLFSQLLEGLAYCHSKGVYHRDLRTELIFLSGSVFAPTLKIGGFGFSKSAAMDSMAKTAVGARGYMAPEVLLATGAYDAAAVDVWAAGVVLFQMLAARMPFCHDTNASGVLDRAMMQRIVRGQYYLPGDIALSLEAQDLLARIFRPEPKQRISLAAMRRHPWLHPDAPSILSPAPQQEAGDDAPPAQQSEEGIRDVIRRARQRRLQRRPSVVTAGGSGHPPALARTSQAFALTADTAVAGH